jgi:Ca-activated chloride channel family protein
VRFVTAPELLNPAGLFWLWLVPLLLVPYLLRQRPRRRIVPALFLFDGVEAARRLRLGGRLHLRPLFLVQLLLLLAAIAALCRPALRSTDVRAALILDNSASLSTIEASGETRFAAAVRAADQEVARDPAGEWDLFVLSPTPHQLAEDLSSSQARGRIAEISPSDCPHPDETVLLSFFDRLAHHGYSKIHVVTDRSAATSGVFEVTRVGSPTTNRAITDLSVIPSSVVDRPASLNVVVENFSPRPARVPIRVEDVARGTLVRSAELALAPDAAASFTADVNAAVQLGVKIEGKDALALDDAASIAPRRKTDGSVLLVAADSRGLPVLEGALGFHLEVVEPARYRPELSRGRALVIFHLAAPAAPPDAPALYLLPPDAPFLPPTSGSVDRPAIAFPLPTHPVARYLNPAALQPRRALLLEESSGWQPLALANRGALILARTGGTPAVVSGIDLLPYLGDRNRPVSILTLNLLSWMLRGGSVDAAGVGQCVPIGRTESDLQHPGTLPLPGAESSPVKPSTKLRPLWPELTLAALLLLAIEAWFQGAGNGVAAVLRLLVASLVIAACLDPMRAVAGAPPKPLVLIDVSKSVLDAARARALRALGLNPTDPVIAFASRPLATSVAELGDSAREAGDEDTDLEAALLELESRGRDPGPAFFVTDGWQTRGDARRALDGLVKRGLRVYPIAETQSLGNDIEVRSLALPAESPAGSTVRVEVLLHSNNPAAVAGRLWLRQGAKTLLREDVKAPPGDSVIAREILAAGEGLLEFAAEFQPANPATDTDRRNDVAKAWLAVRGGRKILLVGHDPRDNRDLESALRQRGFRVTSVARADGDPLPDPSRFAAVILNDVPIGDLPGDYPASLREQVRGGSGLAMVGGPRSFGLGGYQGSPVEDALPVRMKERSREEPRNAVALVIDKSGSMRQEHRISFAREAARQLVEHLKDRDRITVIGFDREPFTVVPLSDVGDIRADFDYRVDRLKPSGGTRLFPALEEARRQLLGEEAKRRHIIVLSDGLSEDAETSAGRRSYYDLALALAEQGVTISTIALGREADTVFLERLAFYGRGAFHETADAASLPELVLGEFEEHGREKTLSEREFRPLPMRDSPLVGALARSDPHWPVVLGLVETELKPLARHDVGVAESSVPLVASWEYGRGRALAVTTDADGRWSDRWVRWKEWSRLWSDLVGWLAPEDRTTAPRFAMEYRGGALEIDYSRFDEDPPGAVSAKISSPDGRTAEIPFERIAPGHYRGSFATSVPGDYRVDVRTARGSVTESPLGYTVPTSATVERPRHEPNWALLDEIARVTGGEVNPTPDRILPAPIPERTEPLAPLLLAAAIAIFLLELIVRRLRAA